MDDDEERALDNLYRTFNGLGSIACMGWELGMNGIGKTYGKGVNRDPCKGGQHFACA